MSNLSVATVSFIAFAVSLLSLKSLRADELADRLAYWETQAFLCDAKQIGVKSPSKLRDDAEHPCDDGDMTLFNGLLCFAGDERGCVGVAEAQDPVSGKWHRSPRIRQLGKNDQGNSDFSPDMALGAELYLIKKKDVDRAQKWLLWVHQNVPCSVEIPFWNYCLLEGLPRFCTDNDGCTIRHGDAAALSATVDFLQHNASMPPLPDGRLRGYLGTFSGYGPLISDLDSRINEAGFPQHLAGVEILVQRAAGVSDAKLVSAANRLFEKNKENAFFAYLAEGSSTQTRAITLAKCPTPSTTLKEPLNQWQWERNDDERPWEHSCFWDCIFMARLLKSSE